MKMFDESWSRPNGKRISVSNAEFAPPSVATLEVDNDIRPKPKVSVIIPVYNAEMYLSHCISSVLNQTLHEIEVICVDDGSSDESMSILLECAKQDSRVVVLSQMNLYAGVARNAGLAVARGEYIHFLDSDDWIDSDTYEKLYGLAKSTKADMVKFRSYTYDQKIGQIKNSYFTNMGGVPENLYEKQLTFKENVRHLVKCSDAPWSGFYKREFLNANHIRFDNLKCANDVSFFYRCIISAKSIWLSKERFVYYRVNNEKSLIGIRPFNFDCQLRQYWIICSMLTNFSDEEKKVVKRHLIHSIFFRAAGYLKRDELPNEAIDKIRRETGEFLAAIPRSIVEDEYLALYDELRAASAPFALSVIIPIYNSELYIGKCLASVRAQTLENIEIICVNDASTDGSLKIVEDHAREDGRIRIINKECNTGAPGICKNIGIDAAGGIYVGIVDSDDYVSPNYFEALYAAAASTDSDMAATVSITNDRDGNLAPANLSVEKNRLLTSPEEKLPLVSGSGSNCNKIYRRQMLRREGIRCCEVRNIAEDNIFSLEAMCVANSIAVVDSAVYYYRKHGASVTSDVRTAKDFYIFEVYRQIERFVANRFQEPLRGRYLQAVRKREEKDFGWFRREVASHDTHEFEVKLKSEFPWVAKALGDNEFQTLDRDVIVSLTSWPGRIGTVDQVIRSLLAQSFRPEKIVLWLAPEQFPNKEEDLPPPLLSLRSPRFEIGWYRDIRSYKKLLPALKKYPEAIIITVDDDNIYGNDCVRKLLREHIRHPQDVVCHRVTRFMCHVDGGYRTFAGGKLYYSGASALNKLVGLGGVLYPPHCFADDIANEELIASLVPTNDDQWFWAQAVMVGHNVRVVENPDVDAHYVKGTQECGLSTINDHGEKLFWKDFARLIEYYPLFDKLLKDEWNRRQSEWNDNMEAYRDKLELWYMKTRLMEANLDHPRTFNEKTQWMKLYESTPIKTRLADKYLVRDWVSEKIGQKYLIPLLGVYDRFEEIDFDKLPDRFVIKCNHGWAFNIIVKDKASLDVADVKAKLDDWMSRNFGKGPGCELHYKNIVPKIIIEQYIENVRSMGDLYDYKFWCFGGQPKYVEFLSERNLAGLKMAFYDMNWQKQSFVSNIDVPLDEKDIPRPDNFDEMKRLASVLAKGFPFVRVDFYRLDDGTIYFGEMTFTSASGGGRWSDPKIGKLFGSWIHLPKLAYNVDTGRYFKPVRRKSLPAEIISRWTRQYSFTWRKKVESVASSLMSWRIDIINKGSSKSNVVFVAKNGECKTFRPAWINKPQSKGIVISGSQNEIDFVIKATDAGMLHLSFKGPDIRHQGTRHPLFADCVSIKIDGKERLRARTTTWHDAPFIVSIQAKAGDVHSIHLSTGIHRYSASELVRVLKALNVSVSADRLLDDYRIRQFYAKKSCGKFKDLLLRVEDKICIGGVKCLRENGLKYTVQHAVGKVVRLFGSKCRW